MSWQVIVVFRDRDYLAPLVDIGDWKSPGWLNLLLSKTVQ